MKFFVLRVCFLIATLIPLSYLCAQDGHLDFVPAEEAQKIAATIATLEGSEVTTITLNIEVLPTIHDFLNSIPPSYLPNMIGLVASFHNSQDNQTIIVQKSEALALLRECHTLFTGDPAVYMADSRSIIIASLNRLYKILNAIHECTIHISAATRSRAETEAQRLLRAQDYLEALDRVYIYSRTQTLARAIAERESFPHTEYGDASKLLLEISQNRTTKDNLLSFITFSIEVIDSQRADYTGMKHFNFTPDLITLWRELIQSLHQDIATQAVSITAGTLKGSEGEKFTTTLSMKKLVLVSHRFTNYLSSLQDGHGGMRGLAFTVEDADGLINAFTRIQRGEITHSELWKTLINLNDLLTELYEKTDFNAVYPGTAEVLEALTSEIVHEVRKTCPPGPTRRTPIVREKTRPGYNETRGPDISHFEARFLSDGTIALNPPSLGDTFYNLLPAGAQRARDRTNVGREVRPAEEPNAVDKVIHWVRGRKMFGRVRSK